MPVASLSEGKVCVCLCDARLEDVGRKLQEEPVRGSLI
jgi:hypothetical protein